MRELETTLRQFGEFLLRARLVNEKAAPHCVRWVRRFLARPASNEPLADQVQRFAEELERRGRWQDWQLRQAQHALQIYFVNFLRRPDWRRQSESVGAENPAASPLQAVDELRRRLRTRHYSYRTECSYIEWVKRFLAYLSERQGVPYPHVESDGVRDYASGCPPTGVGQHAEPGLLRAPVSVPGGTEDREHSQFVESFTGQIDRHLVASGC